MLSTRDLLVRLMACRPVTSEVARVNAAVACVAEFLREAGVAVEWFSLDGRDILYASTRPGRVPEILVNAHLDVVPADEALFVAREEDGWLLGRGTYDCLGNCAMLASLLARLAGRADFGGLFSTDEEIGGATTRHAAEQGVGARRIALILDGRGYAVTIAQKGILGVRLVAHGTAFHSSEPWRGVNAIDRLINGYLKLRPLFPPVTPPDEWHDTMAATLMQAGTVHNRVPDIAEMTLNLRLTGDVSQEEMLERLRRESGLDVEVAMASPPVFCNGGHPEVRGLMTFMRDRLGHEIEVRRTNGATDARHFLHLGIPIAILGVPGRGMHADGEAVDLAALAAYEAMLEDYLTGAGR